MYGYLDWSSYLFFVFPDRDPGVDLYHPYMREQGVIPPDVGAGPVFIKLECIRHTSMLPRIIYVGYKGIDVGGVLVQLIQLQVATQQHSSEPGVVWNEEPALTAHFTGEVIIGCLRPILGLCEVTFFAGDLVKQGSVLYHGYHL